MGFQIVASIQTGSVTLGTSSEKICKRQVFLQHWRLTISVARFLCDVSVGFDFQHGEIHRNLHESSQYIAEIPRFSESDEVNLMLKSNYLNRCGMKRQF